MSYKLEKPYTNKQRADFIVEYSHNQGLVIEETETALYALEPWEKLVDGEIIDNTEEYKVEQAQKERERLDALFMKRGDVFEALILAKGLGKPQIRKMIEEADLDDITKALYLNRFDEAIDFYRGYPIFNLLGEKLDITSEMLDEFFITKDYTKLIPPVIEQDLNSEQSSIEGDNALVEPEKTEDEE